MEPSQELTEFLELVRIASTEYESLKGLNSEHPLLSLVRIEKGADTEEIRFETTNEYDKKYELNPEIILYSLHSAALSNYINELMAAIAVEQTEKELSDFVES